MATSSWYKFNDFTEQLVRGVHDWDAHTFKVALTADVPTASQTVFNPTTNHRPPTNTNGYTAGGTAIGTIGISESNGTTTVTGTQVVFTASGGSIGPFQYAVVYNDTAGDALISYFDYGNSITLTDQETFTIKFNNASPGTMFTITPA
jgi:hypothetical protein